MERPTLDALNTPLPNWLWAELFYRVLSWGGGAVLAGGAGQVELCYSDFRSQCWVQRLHMTRPHHVELQSPAGPFCTLPAELRYWALRLCFGNSNPT